MKMTDDEIDFMHEFDYLHCCCDDCIKRRKDKNG